MSFYNSAYAADPPCKRFILYDRFLRVSYALHFPIRSELSKPTGPELWPTDKK